MGEQERQARYYDRRVKSKRTFKPGDRVRMFRPPYDPNAIKCVHVLIRPIRIVDRRGLENFVVRRKEQDGEQEDFIAHVSF